MRSTLSSRVREAILIALALPILGVLLGGVYSIPAIKVSRGRDPWLSVILLAGLAVTVFGGGLLLRIAPSHLSFVFAAIAAVFLLVRGALGDLERNLEHFGFVHLLALVSLLVAYAVTSVHKYEQSRHDHQFSISR